MSVFKGIGRVALALTTTGTVTGSPPNSIALGVWNATGGGQTAVREGGVTGSILVNMANAYPGGSNSQLATVVTGAGTGVASAINISIPGVASKTSYITGFQVTGAGATAASNIIITLTGVITGTHNYSYTVVAGATVGTPQLLVSFVPAVPASAVNTAITLAVPSFGAGNTISAANIQGYQL